MRAPQGPLPPKFVLTLTLLASAAASWAAWVAMNNRVGERAERAALELVDGARARLTAHSALVRGAAAFAGIAPVDDGGFARYLAALDLPGDHAGLARVDLVPVASAADDPRHREAIDRACATGDPAMTAGVPVDGATGVVIYAPVYAPETGACARVVYAAIRAGELLSSTIADEPLAGGVAFRVRDGTAASAPVLYESGRIDEVEHRARHTLDIAGRTWTLDLLAPAGYASTIERWLAVAVGGFGMIVAAVVYLAMRGQLKARVRAEEQREVLDALEQAGRTLAAELDPARVSERVAQIAVEHTGAELGAVIVGGEVRSWHARSADLGEAGVAALTRGDGARWKSRIAATVGRGDRGDLTLAIAAAKEDAFGDRETALVDGLAIHAAIALDNATMFTRAQRLVLELERGNRALARSNRELDEFAYAASHDLRAPLRSIANLTSWLEEDLGERLDDTARTHLERMRGRVRRLENMVDALLRFARAGRDLVSVEIDLGKLAERVIRELAPPGPARVEIATDLPVVRADPRAVEQVLQQLVGNALRHSGRDDVTIRIGAVAHPDACELVVADDGRGVPEALQPRIWEMFETLEPRDRIDGAGLGLALVRKLAEAGGGRAWCVSRPGEGAEFHVTFPCT